MLRDGGVIADGYDAELDELRAICRRTAGSFLIDLEARERARTGIPNLRVAYNRVHGYYIEVTQRARGEGARRLPPPPDAEERRALHHAGAEDVRGQGAVRARPRARAGEVLVRSSCSRRCNRTSRSCSASRAALAQLDVLATLRRDRADSATTARPRVRDEPCIEIEGGRHPVVEGAGSSALHRQRLPALAPRGACCSSPARTWAASRPTCGRWR